jgi:hypothetical protein
MAILSNQPDNINFLSPLGFRFTLARAPNLNFFATDVNIPSLSFGYTQVPSPFKPIELIGDRLDYGDLQVTFKVDEDFQNYFEIYNWLTGIGHPENFEQYRHYSVSPNGAKEKIYSDGTLTIMNSGMVPNIEVTFKDLFPFALSDINFTTTDSDLNYVTNTVSFKYQNFTIAKI